MKLTDKANTILMNCAECEPLLKLHRQLLEKHAYEIMKTFDMVAETVGASQAIIGIKKSYVQTINALNQHIEEFPRVKIHLLDEVYPMGDEVVLIYEATGRVVRPGGLPIEQGVAVFNVETLYNVYRAVEEHKPVTSKYVSVVAEVENPVTVKVPLGCTLEEVVAQAGGTTVKDPVYFVGGPMMGRIGNGSDPVNKNNERNPGSSKGPCYCHEEAADFFYRSEESSIHLLPLPYMYRSLPETQSGTPDRSGNVHDGSIQSGFQKCESLYQFCILQLLWRLRDVCVSAEPGSENTACRYEGRTS